ncbi:MAG: porin, partial [Prevotella sp.]|nr:porin [Prevotella sp.]
MKHLLAIVMLCYSTSLMAQSKLLSDKDMEWINTIKEHVSINGYAHAGYAYSDANGKTKSDFNLKRTLLWAKVKVTDRLTALFMHDFNSEVQEYWADYRVTNNDALHVKFGQFKNSLSIENPLSPVYLELVDVCSQSVTCYSGCYDPLYGLNYGRDIGLEIYGNLFDNHIRYELEVMNGQGINTHDGNSDKDVIARVEYKPIKELRLVVSGQKGRGHAVGTAAWNPDIKEGD